jgi:hypothetical protein
MKQKRKKVWRIREQKKEKQNALQEEEEEEDYIIPATPGWFGYQ